MEDFWKSERFRTWWETYHWDALAKIDLTWPTEGGERQSLQDYWRDEESRLIEFGGKKWTCLHLPPKDLDGNDYPPDRFDEIKAEPFWRSVENKLASVVLPESFSVDDTDPAARCADFRGAVFPGWAARKKGTKLYCNWSDCFFLARADFTHTMFISGKFRRAQFFEVADFDFSEWYCWADFAETAFYRAAWFWSCKFAEWSGFHSAKFLEGVYLDNAVFENIAVFFGMESAKYASFENTAFRNRAMFWRAKFAGNVSFRTPRSDDFAFGGDVGFGGATFEREADFSGRAFLGRTEFGDARFARVVQFHGARLHPETHFDKHSFEWRSAPRLAAERYFKRESDKIDEARTKLTQREKDESKETKSVRRERRELRKRENLLKRQQRTWQSHAILKLARPHMKAVRAAADAELRRHELAFRTLRLAFAAYQNVEDEMMFYGLELDARCSRRDVPFFERVIAWLYKASSSYGQNMLRPAGLALVIWAGAAGLLFAETRCMAQAPAAAEIGVIALRKFVPFLPTLQDQSASWIAAPGAPASLWPTLATMNVVLPVMAIGLLTVFLIALRRRFQIER